MANRNALFMLPVLLALAGCGSISSGAFSSGSYGVTERAASLNSFRAAHGGRPLRSDSHLAAMAQAHSADMARRDHLDHNGFMQQRGPRGARAENVAYGCKDTPCVIRQWINSSGHRENMLLSGVTKYGLASAVSRSGKKYWTLLVGE